MPVNAEVFIYSGVTLTTAGGSWRLLGTPAPGGGEKIRNVFIKNLRQNRNNKTFSQIIKKNLWNVPNLKLEPLKFTQEKKRVRNLHLGTKTNILLIHTFV